MDILVNAPILPAEEEREKAKHIREAMRCEYYKSIEPKIGKDATVALKKYCDMFDDNLYIWMANLWEPEIGGFYFSNSGRDTEGLLPDIESTVQILRALEGLGFMPSGYSKEIPAEMRAKLIAFAKGLQDSDDGYFYHPQWKKNINTSRRGRDLNWAIDMLRQFGDKPNYKTPIDSAKSDGGRLPEYMKRLEAFKEYLEGLNMQADSYTAGNTVGSQLNEIEASGDEYMTAVEEWMNKNQHEDTGLFEPGNSFNATNGFMKLTGIYFRFKKPIPNIEKGFGSIMNVVYNGPIKTHVCSSYNPWCSFQFIADCLERLNQTDDLYKIKEKLRAEAAELINATYDRISIHKKPDGGFSYQPGNASVTSQKAIAGLGGDKEGDVNASAICSNGIIRQICLALDIPKVPMYSSEDKKIFLDLISKVKVQPKINPRPIDLPL